VIPSLREWYERYQDQGLVVIGNHFPEFSFEKDFDNLQKAITSLKISYPVAQDNDGATWRAYDNHYWPTMYLIEGRYEETEAAITALLSETYP
jgi:hypothetical protein